MKLDHIVILVENLAEAVERYSALGFTVVPGGEHTDGATHNALISFADGTYLELLAFRRAAPEHRWWRFNAGGEQIIDFALLPENIEADIAAAAQRGVLYAGPFDGGRARPDGQYIAWKTGLPPTPDLPFFCYDVTPRSLRVPAGQVWQQANGVTGIAKLTLVVKDLAASAARYAGLLDQAANFEATDRATFRLGATILELQTDSTNILGTAKEVAITGLELVSSEQNSLNEAGGQKPRFLKLSAN